MPQRPQKSTRKNLLERQEEEGKNKRGDHFSAAIFIPPSSLSKLGKQNTSAKKVELPKSTGKFKNKQSIIDNGVFSTAIDDNDILHKDGSINSLFSTLPQYLKLKKDSHFPELDQQHSKEKLLFLSRRMLPESRNALNMKNTLSSLALKAARIKTEVPSSEILSVDKKHIDKKRLKPDKHVVLSSKNLRVDRSTLNLVTESSEALPAKSRNMH